MIKKTIVDEVLNKAALLIGTKEEKPNAGKKVNDFLASVGLSPGNPWCAAFCYYVIDKVLGKLNIINPVRKTGYCPYLEAWAKSAQCYHDRPQVGDIFLLIGKRRDGVRRAFHCGFVSGVSADGSEVESIEGNTNLDGGAEGYGVFRRRRKTEPSPGFDMRYVRWVDKLPIGANPSETPPQYLCKLPNGCEIELMRRNDHLLAPLRALGEMSGIVVTWDAESQAVLYDGTPLPMEIIRVGSVAYGLIREVADAMGWLLDINHDRRVVRVLQ